MSLNLLVLGESKNGKTASTRFLDSKDTFVIMPHPKKVYVKNSSRFNTKTKEGNVMISGDIRSVPKFIRAVSTKPEYAKFKTLILDDANYWLQNFILEKEAEPKKGDKVFTTYREVAVFFSHIVNAIKEARPDLIVVMMGHTEQGESGVTKFKTVGKMSDNLITLEGTTDYIIEARRSKGKVDDTDYVFLTKGDTALDIASVPLDMEIDQWIVNDIRLVLDKMRGDII